LEWGTGFEAKSSKAEVEGGDQMSRKTAAYLAFFSGVVLAFSSFAVRADDAQIARGKYLVGIAGCNDCHTPGYFFGKPDMANFLSGSEVGFEIPGLGVFVGRNITPDKETGIGEWTEDQIVAALQTGKRPDGRELAPIMPWHAFATLTEEDVTAIAVFLKSIPAVSRKIPDPVGPGGAVTTFMFRILPPGETAAAAPK
jgi:mono/diheme cytochrome c family protein